MGWAPAFAAENVDGKTDEEKETKKGLLYRAARIFDSGASDKERAEKVYLKLIELDPDDDIAQIALEEIRKQLGKYEEIVEMPEVVDEINYLFARKIKVHTANRACS